MASFFHHLFCFLLLQLPLFISAQTYNNITLGTSISNLQENPYWTSPSGDFAFGFYPHQNLFLLATWYSKIPVRTIVWTANDGKPVERGAKIQLISNGVLSLTTSNGTEIWKAEAIDNSQVAYAAMLNTGNFVLFTAESRFVWATFDNPTDTIMPNQVLDLGKKLSSRLTKEDYTIGRFELVLQGDGNLEFYTIARPTDSRNDPYYGSNINDNGTQLVFNQSGYIYITLKSGGVHSLSSARPLSTEDYYQRATLDYDGVFRQYTYTKVSANGTWPESWSTSWSLPQDICTSNFGEFGSGVCGFNSYCRLAEDQRPVCLCLPGYSYLDPTNTFKGCIPNFTQQACGTVEPRIVDGFEMQRLPSTNWPMGDYERFLSMNEEWCSETCLKDCLCAAAHIGVRGCWLKKFPLSRGYMTSGTGVSLIKVANSSAERIPRTAYNGNIEEDKKWIIPGSILLAISVVVNLLFLFLVIYIGCYKKKTKRQTYTRPFGGNLRSFTYKELNEATDGFKEQLGKGAFSTVYKGELKSDSGCLVAVKRLDKVVEGNDKEFQAEVSAIGKTNQKYLVQLLGFCNEEAHRLLVYEFMKNGSLENFLFGSLRLKWNQRIQIALGIARGLAYLHEDCSSQIIHCDIKPQNILLDESYVARISDFGLAKLLKSDQTRTTTGIRGTRGYVAPEWFRNMPITAKVDVYSFGIMLLEILFCRKNVELKVGDEEIEILSDLAYEYYQQKELHLLLVNDEEAKNDGKSLESMVMVALWCIQEDPSLRPSMKKVTQMLEGAVEISMPPSPNPSSFSNISPIV
ncbi:hypothetical protein AQUCO_00500462v1 [Aquilegia coerulea]|uniref:Receptor-like serine/threonine-protein kinase n=1 Tax=Aquilegia coerulea TaxID=218851 RepID=A0A2G5ES37_AQUCA|nr:hypothetical protein AQUCO_00500462v1 [Aquilegia coerulea]